MDAEEEDNWSYSFPPSVEMLPELLTAAKEVKDLGKSLPAAPQKSQESLSQSSKSGSLYEEPIGASPIPAPLRLNGVAAPPSPSIPFLGENNPVVMMSGSQVLQPALMSKSTPANPQTTMKDASSVMSTEHKYNALAGSGDSVTPPLTPSSHSDFQSSLRIWQQKTSEDESERLEREKDSADAMSPLLKSPRAGSHDSHDPKIIAYRKSTHRRSESNSYNDPELFERYDVRLYVAEKYKDTPYRYATMKRNVDFHQIFKSLDLTDRLLDDYACALSREILLQGRLYVTEHCVCFNSNLLGWVTTVVVPMEDIIRIDKKSTAGLFPNGIVVETKNEKHYFASFLSRDYTYDFIRTVWSASTGKDMTDLDSNPTGMSEEAKTENSERRISNYIMSIDEDAHDDASAWTDKNFDENAEVFDDGLEDSDESDHDAGSVVRKESITQSTAQLTKVKSLKPESEYKNLGPDTHAPTSITETFEGSDQETEVANDVVEAPLGAAFEIMFGREHPEFHRRILDDQGATEVSEYGQFTSMEEDPSKSKRSYTYRRPLGFAIGPKSTKCYVDEIIEHLDYSDYIVVQSITTTPDVPSGGSFSVKTRFYFWWGENNTTHVRIAFYVDWTGRSWIKNMVESSTSSAQSSVNKKILEELKTEVEKQVVYGDNSSKPMVIEKPSTEAPSPPPLPPKEIEATSTAESTARKSYSVSVSTRAIVVFGLLFVVILLCLNIYLLVKLAGAVLETKALLAKHLKIISKVSEIVFESGNGPWYEKFVEDKDANKKSQVLSLARRAVSMLDESQAKSLKETLEEIF